MLALPAPGPDWTLPADLGPGEACFKVWAHDGTFTRLRFGLLWNMHVIGWVRGRRGREPIEQPAACLFDSPSTRDVATLEGCPCARCATSRPLGTIRTRSRCQAESPDRRPGSRA